MARKRQVDVDAERSIKNAYHTRSFLLIDLVKLGQLVILELI